jgi:hypothetical protein
MGTTTVSITPLPMSQQQTQAVVSPAPQQDDSQFTIFQQPPEAPVNSYLMVENEPKKYPAWYPKKFLSQSQAQDVVSQPQTQNIIISNQVQVLPQSSTNLSVLRQSIQTQRFLPGAVPVPNVMRLRREDATFAIQKAGLSVGNIIRVQHPQWRSGLVMQQSPRARAVVPTGTQIHLWVTN